MSGIAVVNCFPGKGSAVFPKRTFNIQQSFHLSIHSGASPSRIALSASSDSNHQNYTEKSIENLNNYFSCQNENFFNEMNVAAHGG